MFLDTIKKSQTAIEAMRKDMLSHASMSLKVNPLKKSKEEAQKEMLDAELDLMSKQQEGADTSELQKKISELRARTLLFKKLRGKSRRFPSVNRHLLTKNNLADQS